MIRSDVAGLDSHWYPVSLQCGLCSKELQYDLVIRLESLQEEWGLVSSMAGVTLPPLPHMNKAHTGASQGDDEIFTIWKIS